MYADASLRTAGRAISGRAISFALTLTLALAACGRETEGPPGTDGRPDGGPAAMADGGPLDGSAPDAGGCLDPEEGCWSCPPVTSGELLNACTDATCAAFPITQARLPRLRSDGSLPPLP